MQFEVPQFIEIEDKIFGPLTWRQFIYLGGGGAVATAIFFVSPHWILFAIFGLPIIAFSAALAFYPVNNRPFSFLVEAVYNYFRKQRTYFWKQKNNVVHNKQTFAPTTTVRNPILPKLNSPNGNRPKKDINSLARKLELEALQSSK